MSVDRRAHGLRLRARHRPRALDAASTATRSGCEQIGDGAWPEFQLGENVSLYLIDPTNIGQEFTAPHTAPIALRVADVAEARAELEAKGVVFAGETFDTGVCHMALFQRSRRQRRSCCTGGTRPA